MARRAIRAALAVASKNVEPEQFGPRKSPRQARAIATVDAILDAAADVLETQGPDGYTTNAIAVRAGTCIGSLYQYFPNKTALTQALIAREDRTLLGELTLLPRSAAGANLLRRLIQITVARRMRCPVLARLLEMEKVRLPLTSETRQLQELFASTVRRCIGDALTAMEPCLSQDISSIIAAMVDTAWQRGERDEKVLAIRIGQAVSGYVSMLRRSARHSKRTGRNGLASVHE